MPVKETSIEIELAEEPSGVDMPLAEVVIGDNVALIPDVTQLTLNDFKLSGADTDSAADLLVLGDLSSMIDLRNMTLGAAVSGWQRTQLSELTLDQYDFLAEMTIAQVADMAGLHNKTVAEVPIVEKAILTFLNHPVLMREQKVTLSRFLSRYPEIGSIKLGLLELPQYHYSAIPKLLSVPITSIPNWQQLAISSIAGLKDLPIHQNVRGDGHIVTLVTMRDQDTTAVKLKHRSNLFVTWPEELSENALQPFDSFFLKPTIAGETIRISAYFRSCSVNSTSCRFVGPFDYLNYKVGDRFFISHADWIALNMQTRRSINFKQEPTPSISMQPTTDPFYSETLLRATAVGMSIVLITGTPALLLLLSKRRRTKS